MPINQPSGQIKFTNVAIVRLKKGKKRFELACYKNKLLEYRSGTETDLDNVLQVPTIFFQVSKGNSAPNAELVKAFGSSTSKEEIIQEILRKGEVQVGERERKEALDRIEREVLELVSSRLVDPDTKRVYTTGMISKALNQLSSASAQHHQQQQAGEKEKEKTKGKTTSAAEHGQQAALEHKAVEEGDTPIGSAAAAAAASKKPLWTGVTQSKSAKIQALDAIKALIAWQPIPVMRARMRLRITCPVTILKQVARVAPTTTLSSSSDALAGATGSDTEDAPVPVKSGKGGNKKGKIGKKNKKGTSDGDTDDGSSAPTTPAEKQSSRTVKDCILGYFEEIETQEVAGDEWEVVGFAEPGAFKGLSEFVGGETKGRGRVEVLDMSVRHDD
ncbi:hypothetical protein KEM54_006223 [Ascosphaera aggregata]|nr:hypothetical protein KEM54_006223 [Ascosphaera aggregata]